MGGIKNNFYLALFALFIDIFFISQNPIKIIPFLFAMAFIFSLTFYKVQRFFILYILPLVLILFIYLTLKENTFLEVYQKGFITDINLKKEVSFGNIWFNLFLINTVLAFLNMLPIVGLDGWEVYKDGYIRKIKDTYVFRIFTYFALSWLVLLSIAPLVGDVKNIFLWIIKLFN